MRTAAGRRLAHEARKLRGEGTDVLVLQPGRGELASHARLQRSEAELLLELTLHGDLEDLVDAERQLEVQTGVSFEPRGEIIAHRCLAAKHTRSVPSGECDDG